MDTYRRIVSLDFKRVDVRVGLSCPQAAVDGLSGAGFDDVLAGGRIVHSQERQVDDTEFSVSSGVHQSGISICNTSYIQINENTMNKKKIRLTMKFTWDEIHFDGGLGAFGEDARQSFTFGNADFHQPAGRYLICSTKRKNCVKVKQKH